MSSFAQQIANRKFTSPPSLKSKTTPKVSAPENFDQASVEEKDSFSWGKAALGLGLVASALSGCGTQQAPAPDPGVYEMEAPELVVMSDNIQRIDIEREQTEECTGIGEDRDCDWEDVAYHSMGIHLGEGVVQDFNGNLFAAPQLVAKQAPGNAVFSPEGVEIDGVLGTGGAMTRKDGDSFETRGSLLGRTEIDVNSNSIDVKGKSIFGTHRLTNVTTTDGVATVKEGRYVQAVVQSQGDHVLVQTKRGRTMAEITHSEDDGNYTVKRPGFLGGPTTEVQYNENSLTRKDGRWTTARVSRVGEDQVKVKQGPFGVVTTTSKADGWNDNYAGPGSTDYKIEGGTKISER